MSKSKNNGETTDNKEMQIQLALATIEKAFGKEAIISNTSDFSDIKRISTGSISLDKALRGGYARNRMIEIFGPESSGKTTLALHAIAEAQKTGDTCAFIDAEHALDYQYARDLGVNMDALLISQPDCGEQALEIADILVRSGAVGLIVIDSVAALVPKAELEGDMGQSHIGLQARLMSQACRKLTSLLKKAGTTIIFINQIRMKVGVMFGSPEVTSGGNALKFYASQRIDIRKKAIIKDGKDNEKGEASAIEVKVKVAKNKTGNPFKEVLIEIEFGKGINWAKDLLNMGVERNIIEKSGSWYSYKGERLGQGGATVSQLLKENTSMAGEIRERLLSGE